VLARVSLVLLSVLVLAWSAVLLRDQERGRAAAERLLEDPKSPPEEFGRDMERLEAVELLNPDSQWKLYRSYFWLLRARPGRAAQLAEGLVRDEPENIRAWQQLYLSSRGRDPARSRQALAMTRRLNPLGRENPR